jgi:hypothetical protein
MDKRFGPPYPAPLTFHSFNGMKTPSEEELSLLLLPKILPQIPEAGTDSTLLEFLKIIQDHPLLKYFHPTNELYWLHKEVSAAVELYLTPDLFKVSRFMLKSFINLVILMPYPQQLKETSEPEPKKHSSRKSKD